MEIGFSVIDDISTYNLLTVEDWINPSLEEMLALIADVAAAEPTPD